MEETIIPHWLTQRASLTPDALALEFVDGTTLTFASLQSRSKTFAKKLASLGAKTGDRIAILSTNQLEMIVAIHAISYLGAVAVMLNTRLTTNELMYQLTASKAMLLLTTEDLESGKALDFTPIVTYETVAETIETNVVLVEEISLASPFTMMFTSGTTGLPKAVLHTYGNHWWSATGSILNLGLQADDKWLLPLPLFHVGGLSILIRSVLYGIPAFVMEKYEATLFYEVIRNKKITIVSIVTLMLKQLLQQLGEAAMPVHVRCLLLGGGSVPEHLLQQVKAKQLPLFQSYGMTETSSQIVTLSATDALRKLGSSGKPLFPAQVAIQEKDATGVGEIIVKGPMVMNGYDHHPEANERAFTDGWFKTGDLGYIDEEGFLYVVERRTDLIISGGENIYPSEVEGEIIQIQGVIDVGVFGKADENWGQVPIACVVREDTQVTEQVIFAQLKQQLASYKMPQQIHFVESLPRNASNKLMRHRLANLITE